MGGVVSQFAQYPPPQSTSFMDVPAWLLWAHGLPPPVQISPVSLCPSSPGRPTGRPMPAPKIISCFPEFPLSTTMNFTCFLSQHILEFQWELLYTEHT